ncbi:MAG: tRNA (adenosine(37)-N6)-threonylcarbamoyltransferase complex ATPase subunit type 1 TsaE [Rhodothermales bacterium]|nr:tRNA (adenosine(37)-N6)-threonylcarbamoyltransferase complex ATPase subunit type 1 TsaE [Rhodothermales bacterium]
MSVGVSLEGMLPRETASAEETRSLGARLSAVLPAGAVVALVGDLGAGKTHLVKGLVDGLGGAGDEVSSPTFTIAQEYEADGDLILHVDAYRVDDPREFVEMGLEDSMDAARLVAIEWPEKMGSALPPDAVRVEITHLGGDRRRIRYLP